MANARKNKIAVFDIDGTIFRSSLLIEFNKGLMQAGVIPRSVVGEIKDEYFAWVERRGNYDDYIKKVVEMHSKAIKGKKQKDIMATLETTFKFHKDRVYRYTRNLIDELKKDYLLLAISGSPVEMVEPFGDHFGFYRAWGSVYGIDSNGFYTGEVVDKKSVAQKREILERFVQENNLTLEGSWGVGDTETDISFLEIVDHPIVFNPTATLYKEAQRRHWEVIVERKNVIYKISSGGFVDKDHFNQ